MVVMMFKGFWSLFSVIVLFILMWLSIDSHIEQDKFELRLEGVRSQREIQNCAHKILMKNDGFYLQLLLRGDTTRDKVLDICSLRR